MRSGTYKLRLLGRFELRAPSGEALPLSAKKNQVLLAILALAAGNPVPRERLLGILWGDRGEAQARSSLRQAFTALRKTFAATNESPLRVVEGAAALNPEAIEVDALAFQEGCATGSEAALALWSGGFLEGLSLPDAAAQDWLEGERRRLQELYQDGLAVLMRDQAVAGQPAEALTSARQLLSSNPLDEGALRLMMQCLADTGERAKALQHYQDFAALLEQELQLAPGPETQALYESIRSSAGGAPAAAPARDQAENAKKGSQKISIAVLPIDCLSTDPELSYLADGITRELITELGRFSAQEMVAAATMFAYKGRPIDLREVSREVGADYVLEGNLQSAAGRLRISAQITDAESGRQIWGNRYDGATDDPFAFQDEVIGKISANLYHPLMKAAAQRARDLPRDAPDIQTLYMQSHHHVERPTAAGMAEARRVCEQIIAIDPTFPLVYEHLAWVNLHSAYNGWVDDPWAGFQKAKDYAEQGIAHEEMDGYLRSALGLAEVYLGNFKRGLAELQMAGSINPNDAEYPAWLGIGLTVVGRLAEAQSAFDEANRLSPGYHPIDLFRGDAYFAAGNPRAALPHYDAFLTVLPEYNWALVGKAAAHSECQEPAAAQAAVARLQEQGPRITCDYLKRLLQARQPAVVDRLLTALEAAGLPPGTASVPTVAEAPRPTADNPKIAVLPFENMSGNPAQDYFSDGLTEDIITELSRFKSLFVIARHSSFTFKGKQQDLTKVAQELGVRYLVVGSLRQAGKRIRISAQLVDADSGKQLWAERYDRELEDIFALQDEITQTIVGTVWGRVELASLRRAARLSPEDLEAYDLVLRARALVLKFEKADNAQATKLLEKALELDPENVNALATLALAEMMNAVEYWVPERAETLARSKALAREAVKLDESDSRAWWQLAEIELMDGNHEGARASLDKVMALNPNDIEGRAVNALYFAAIGDAEAMAAEFEEAQRRNPIDFTWLPWIKGNCLVVVGHYAEALAVYRALSLDVNEARLWQAIAFAHTGKLEEAQAQLTAFLKTAKLEMADFPGERVADWEDYCRGISGCRDRALLDPLLDGLCKAGMKD